MMTKRAGWMVFSLAVASMAQAAPAVFWASDPVRPDETVMVQGAEFGAAPTIEIGRLRDDAAGAAAETLSLVQSPQTIKPLQVSDHSVKFVVPADFKPGTFAFRIRDGARSSPVTVLNAPDVWWMQGDESQFATPGGWVRIFGKCLATGGKTRVRMISAANEVREFAAVGDDYGVRIEVPKEWVPGKYQVQLHNGCMGEAGWKRAGSITITPPVQWKRDVFKMSDFQGTPSQALQGALDKARANGGGIVLVPRGRWQLHQPIEIPSGTVLKGESRELSSIYWEDFKEVPPVLIKGANFGITDLSIYAQHYKTFLDVLPGSTRLVLNNLTIRANNFFGMGEPGEMHNGRMAPKNVINEMYLFTINYPNFQITNCDLYTNGRAICLSPKGFVEPDGPRFSGIISGNKISGGQGYSLEAADGVIFENNEVSGSSVMSTGNSLNSYFNNFVRHVYFAKNRIHDIYGYDQEMMTLDSSGSAYFGKIAKVDGTRLTLAADPIFKDYNQHRTDYRGGVVAIMGGTGAGQYRVVTANKDREWTVDQPWVVAPDASSIVTITHHRGRNIFYKNEFTDGGCCQLYGAAFDGLVVGNTARRTAGFIVWGGNQEGFGWQPSWNCQFMDNEIIEGNGASWRYGQIGTSTSGIIPSTVTGKLPDSVTQKDIDAQHYTGPLVRTAVFRRNKFNSNGRYEMYGIVDNVLIENSVIRDTDIGIRLSGGITDILIRNNSFENVKTPVEGGDRPTVVRLPATAPAKKLPGDLKQSEMDAYRAWVAAMPADAQAWEHDIEQWAGDFYVTIHVRYHLPEFVFVRDNPALPRVCIIGDSISMGYTPPVRDALAGKANVHRAPANCGPTTTGLRDMDGWLGTGKWDIIVFNFGIHDSMSGKTEPYAANLEKVIARLRKTGARLVWVRSTPYVLDTPNKVPPEKMNAVADEVMARNGIPICDVFGVIQDKVDTLRSKDGCHFNGEGYQIIGRAVTQSLETELAALKDQKAAR